MPIKIFNYIILSLVILFCSHTRVMAQEQHIPIKVGNWFGISDLQKNIIIEPQYTLVQLEATKKKVYFIAKKKINDSTSLNSYILNGKILIADVENATFERIGSLLKAIVKTEPQKDKSITLYSENGKRINSKTYKLVHLLMKTDNQELYYLEDSNQVIKLAIYDNKKQEFVQIIASNLSHISSYCSDTNSEFIWNLIADKKEYFLLTKEIEGNIDTKLIQLSQADLSKNDKRTDIQSTNKPLYNYDSSNFGEINEWKLEQIQSNLEYSFANNNIEVEEFEVDKFYQITFKNFYDNIKPNLNIEINKENFEYYFDSYYKNKIKINEKVGIYDTNYEKWFILPEYDEIYVVPNPVKQLVLKKDNQYIFVEEIDMYGFPIDTTKLSSFSDIPIQFFKRSMGYARYLENVLYLYDPETLEFSHYALTDGTEFIQP